jgi:hypothetical protein
MTRNHHHENEPGQKRQNGACDALNAKLRLSQLAAGHSHMGTEVPETDVELAQGLTEEHTHYSMSCFVEKCVQEGYKQSDKQP